MSKATLALGTPGPGTMSGCAPDFSKLTAMQASRDSLRDIRAGIGKLLLAGE